MDLTERPDSPYRIERRLGGGGIGEVLSAWDEQLRRRVALKRIRPELAGDAAARARFRRAAAAAAALDHPAIVRIHTLMRAADGGDFLIMELIDGETLADRLRGGLLPVVMVARFAAEIAGGLAAAHARRIAHWHLGTANVMITPSGHAKIVGFGGASGWPEVDGAADAPTGARTPVPPVLQAEMQGLPLPAHQDIPAQPVLDLPPEAISDLPALGRILREMLGSGDRPVVPAALSGLADDLLCELAEPGPVDPAAVARVAEVLTQIAGELDSAARPQSAAPDLRTGSRRWSPWGRWAGRPFWRRRAVGALIVVAAVALAVAAVQQLPRHAGGRPLTVVIPRPAVVFGAADEASPAVSGRSTEHELLVLGLRTALLHAASNLDGVFAWPAELVDAAAAATPPPGHTGEGSGAAAVAEPALGGEHAGRTGTTPGAGGAVLKARSLGADEALTARLSCQADTCQVTLSRVAAADGRLLWTESLEAAIGEPYLLAAAAERYVAEGYPGHHQRAGALGLEVRPQDFAAYLALLRGLDNTAAGGLTSPAALAHLAAIRARSPHFLEATLLAARLSTSPPPLGEQRPQLQPIPDDGAVALGILHQAHLIAPADSRPLCAEVAAALAARQIGRARAALQDLAHLEPGAPEILLRRLPPAQRRALSSGSGAAPTAVRAPL
jgi:hypothetical protein